MCCIATSYHCTADKNSCSCLKTSQWRAKSIRVYNIYGKSKKCLHTYFVFFKLSAVFFFSNCQYYVLYTAQHTVSRLCRKHATDVPLQVSLSILVVQSLFSDFLNVEGKVFMHLQQTLSLAFHCQARPVLPGHRRRRQVASVFRFQASKRLN